MIIFAQRARASCEIAEQIARNIFKIRPDFNLGCCAKMIIFAQRDLQHVC